MFDLEVSVVSCRCTVWLLFVVWIGGIMSAARLWTTDWGSVLSWTCLVWKVLTGRCDVLQRTLAVLGGH